MPAAVTFAVRALLGHLPGTDGKWQGWRFWKGELWSPEGYRFTAGDLHAQRYERLTLDSQRRRILELEAQIAVLVRERAQRDTAANDAAEVRPPQAGPRTVTPAAG